MISRTIFRDYDIRGKVPGDLSPEDAVLIANAFAHKLREEFGGRKCTLAVGMDVRPTSPELRDSAVKGILDAGCDALKLGVCPSPLTYFAAHYHKLDGYIMITGSHNPPEYNGIKLGSVNTVYHTDAILNLRNDIITLGHRKERFTGTQKSIDITKDYADWCEEHFRKLQSDISKLSRKPKVVLDAGNGAASRIAPEVFRRTGCDVVPLYCEEDGTFPNHHPDPTVDENLADAVKIMDKEDADFVAAYDGDADRIVIALPGGKVIRGDILLGIFARDLLRKEPGSAVVGDVKASDALYDMIADCGGRGIMWKSGHSMIKVKMGEEKALLAGETSAHIFFGDRYFGFDDAVYASLRFLEIYVNALSSGEVSDASGLLEGLTKYVNTPELRLECGEEEKVEITEKLKRVFTDESFQEWNGIREVNCVDGIRVRFERGWGLVRPSNTQAVIVFRFEALDEESLNNYIALFEKEAERRIV
ncbi:phosphomannomutase/phosphoglucomutase [Limisalsivibrio acetivorans]|uniref:phosphomannomutase/phosphoglucomutase n=1 Tax=Limisalsivibrio acetivorans TaxID=1304888 RepID=UPI0003B6F3A8|nr:phosphomannomutase/phosphoglucomutase [Limisalsivibrio acetivorans]